MSLTDRKPAMQDSTALFLCYEGAISVANSVISLSFHIFLKTLSYSIGDFYPIGDDHSCDLRSVASTYHTTDEYTCMGPGEDKHMLGRIPNLRSKHKLPPGTLKQELSRQAVSRYKNLK